MVYSSFAVTLMVLDDDDDDDDDDKQGNDDNVRCTDHMDTISRQIQLDLEWHVFRRDRSASGIFSIESSFCIIWSGIYTSYKCYEYQSVLLH